jgi:predicted nuclease of predicted toxin-antitoxin system
MKFKLDENFGRSVQKFFTEGGHDAVTVRDEKLGGAADERVLQAATAEGRILVTLDHDFANVLRFPPEETAGVAVINPPGRVSTPLLSQLVLALLQALTTGRLSGKLWIVEPGRIREHITEPSDEEEA